MELQIQNLRRRVALGDDEAKVALLAARHRSGELAWDQILLAAYLGDEAAEAVAGRWAKPASKHHRRWARGLTRFGEEVAARSVLRLHQAMVRGLQAISDRVDWRRRHRIGRPLPAAFGHTVRNAERWAEVRFDACDIVHAAELANGVKGNARLYGAVRHAALRDSWGGVGWPLCTLGDMVSGRAGEVLEPSLLDAARWLAPSRSGWGSNQAINALRDAVSETLVAWCLG
jgi:hypothetical protein